MLSARRVAIWRVRSASDRLVHARTDQRPPPLMDVCGPRRSTTGTTWGEPDLNPAPNLARTR